MTATTDSIVHKHPHTAFTYSQLCHFPLVNQYIFNQPSPVLKSVASRPGCVFVCILCVHISCCQDIPHILAASHQDVPSLGGGSCVLVCITVWVGIVCIAFVLSHHQAVSVIISCMLCRAGKSPVLLQISFTVFCRVDSASCCSSDELYTLPTILPNHSYCFVCDYCNCA